MKHFITKIFPIGIFIIVQLTSLSAKQPFNMDSLKVVLMHATEDKTTESLLRMAAQISHKDFNTAIAYIHIARDQATKANNQKDLFNINREMGFVFEENNHLQNALNSYNSCMDIAQKLDNNSLKLTIFTDLAIVHEKMSEYAIAKNYHLKAIDLAEREGDVETVENGYHGLGSLYETVGEYETAIDYYFQSLNIAEQRKSTEGVIITLQNIANTYRHLKHETESLETIERAHSLATTLNNKNLIASTLYDFAHILTSFGKYQEALTKQKSSIFVYRQSEDGISISRGLVNIAEIYTHLELYDEAESYFMECFDYEKYLSTLESARLYSRLGKLYLKQNKIDTAEVAFKKSLVFSEAGNYKELTQQNNYDLYKINQSKGNNKLALQYLETVGSFVSLIQKKWGKDLDEEANQYMDFVTSGVTRMNNLLGDLLAYSRITSSVAENERTALGDILKDVTDNLRRKIITNKATLNFPAEKIDLQISRVHLLQLMQNLIGNGLKFIPKDRLPIITVKTKLTSDAFIISVTDNGIGINKDYSHKVFNLFHQLNKRAGYEGTGIGLTICKNIVDKYNGKIWFDSVLTEGTTFHISLPPETLIGISKTKMPQTEAKTVVS